MSSSTPPSPLNTPRRGLNPLTRIFRSQAKHRGNFPLSTSRCPDTSLLTLSYLYRAGYSPSSPPHTVLPRIYHFPASPRGAWVRQWLTFWRPGKQVPGSANTRRELISTSPRPSHPEPALQGLALLLSLSVAGLLDHLLTSNPPPLLDLSQRGGTLVGAHTCSG